MKRLALVIFVFSSLCLFSQEVTMTGVLHDDETGGLLKHAVIQVAGKQVKSDSTGFFKISVPTGKKLQVHIKHPEHRSFQQSVLLHKDSNFVFILKPLVVSLHEVVVRAQKDNQFGISRLNNVEGTTIYAGKKSEAVYVQDLGANLASNNSRQIFSKVPGINIFENDGSGTTIGIGGRGLNPNRISNFNTRQNGYDISADALGYPESYYTPPTEALERVEILRGAAGLQFGTQFGGMINYKFSEPPVDKKLSGDFRQTAGSFGFFNSFIRLSGTTKKFSYNTFYQYKQYAGWRERSALNSHNAFASLGYRVNPKLFIKGEYTYMNYLSQQAGGLTDAQFKTDASQVMRNRNWFRVNWNLASFSADYKVNDCTRISLMSFGLLAGREALGVLTPANRPDVAGTNRNLLKDSYRNYGAELKLLHRYDLLNQQSHLLIGSRYYKGQTTRLQGDADKTDAPTFNFLNPGNLENSSYVFPSENYAVFAENIFQLSSKWSVTPGVRYEFIKTASEGYYRILNTDLSGASILDKTVYDNRSSARDFLLAGIGSQFKLNAAVEVYGNFSQNYRSINFNDMRVLNPNFEVDPNLKDENGYTADGGIRGSLKDLLYFDVSVFMVKYNDRIGTDLRLDSATYQLMRVRTNIADSRNSGIEAMAELDWLKLISKENKHRLSTFVNLSLIDAVYISDKKVFNNKKVEFVPSTILRTGFTYGYKKFKLTYQYSYVSEQFSEATNAPTSPSGTFGLIPAYSVMDLSASYVYKKVGFSAGINNLRNNKYFTRRAEGYPGPGIIPADPRNFYITLRYTF